jgi:cytochrome c biogenesis protein CcmG/thiol:disulfide interchange protein DsbE
MRRALIPGLVSVLAVGLVALLIFGVLQTTTDTSIDEAVANGERPPAHDVELARLDGRGTGSLADHRGDVVLVNFFASWCQPCEEEAPILERAHRLLARHGGTVLGIAVDDARARTQAFVNRHGLTFPVLRDVERSFAKGYDITGLPETFLIDRDGRIVALARNQVTQRWIDEHLTPLLEAGA